MNGWHRRFVWPALLVVQPAVQATKTRELVREYTAAFEARREVAWRDSVHRSLRPDASTRALLDGTLARLEFRFEDAEAAYLRALRARTQAAALPARVGLASVRSARGEVVAARAALDSLVAPLLAAGDSVGAAETQVGIGLLTLRTGTIDSARARIADARRLAPRPDSILQARFACAELQLQTRTGTRISNASWASSLAQAQRAGARYEADCRFIYAQYLSALGAAPAAIAMFDTVATLQDQLRLWNGLSASRQWQGSELISRGYYTAARKRLDEAVGYADRSHSINGAAWARLELSRLATFSGAPSEAAAYLRQARPMFVATGDALGRLSADKSLAESLLLNGDFAGADSLLTQLASELPRLQPIWQASTLAARAWNVGRDDVERSALLLDSLEQLTKARNQPGYAVELQYQRALLSLRRGNPQAALLRLDSLAASRLVGPYRFEVLERRAEALAASGAIDSAIAVFGVAMRTMEIWRQGMPRRELALAVLQNRAMDWDKDLDMATLIGRVASSGHAVDALAMAEARRVRGREQESMQRAGLGLDVSTTSRIVDPRGSTPLIIPAPARGAMDAQRLPALAVARLSDADAVLSYVTGVGGEPTTVFVLTRGGVIPVRLAAIDSLRTSIGTFTALLASGRHSEAMAAEIARAVILPALNALPASVERVTIVADGELHRLPFSALTLPSGETLGAHYRLSFALSVEDALGGVRRAAREPGARVLAIGAPSQMPAVDGVALPSLPGARAEVSMVNDRFALSRQLRGAHATRASVLAQASRGGTVLHLATHALSDPGSYTRTAIALQPTTTDDGLLHTADLERYPVPFDLVVLSACASGEGVLLTGQGVHGLVGALLDAGAGGVIATRWPIGDRAIVPWMTRLYDELARDGDPVRAVQATQQAAIAAGASPAIWATLQYVGDPTVRVTLTPRAPSVWQRLTGTLGRWLGLR